MATTDERPPTRRRALAGGLAVAACLTCCLLPVAAAGGLLAGLVTPLPARSCPLSCWEWSQPARSGRGGGDVAPDPQP